MSNLTSTLEVRAFRNSKAISDFHFERRAGRIEFSFPGLARITKFGVVNEHVVFDAKICTTVSPKSYSLPLEPARYSLVADTGEVELRIQFAKVTAIKPPKRQELMPWVWAVGGHLVILIFSLLITHNPTWWEQDAASSVQADAAESNQTPIAASGASGQAVDPSRVPYSGFSLWKLLQSMAPKPTKEQRLSSLLSSELVMADNLTTNAGANGGSGGSSAGAITGGFSIGQSRPLSADQIARNAKSAPPELPAVSPTELTKAEMELKVKMDEAQKQMRSFYTKVLQQDPSFNTRVIVTAKISRGGKLIDIKPVSQGHNPDQNSLATQLVASMTTLLANLTVPEALAGTSVRREFIFWK